MTVQISGKNVDVGDSLRQSIQGRLEEAIGKYFGGGYTGRVTLGRDGTLFKTECRLNLDTGIMLSSHGEAIDAYQSFDKSAERLEKRLRRYNRRLRDHHARDFADSDVSAANYTLAEEPADDEGSDNPVIVAETQAPLKKMTVSTAVMAMDLAEQPILMFTNSANNRLNLVYRRSDGHIGWIDPQTDAE